jgi:hypothetical protein
MSHLVPTSTLIDIASHSSKAVRLFLLMSETNAPYLLDKMSYLDNNSDPMDIVLALDADLNTSVSMIKAISLLVDSLNENHAHPEFKGDEGDFRKLFPKNYDEKTKTLSIFGMTLKPSSGVIYKTNPDDLKKELFDTIFKEGLSNYPYSSFKRHKSLLRSLQKTGRPSSNSDFADALAYVSSISTIPRWENFYKSAIATTGGFHDFRKSLSDKERRLVDEKVYSDRTMIYGVIKSSTFITKKNGVEQTSSKHKVKASVVSKIEQLVKEIPYLKAVEIDQKTNIEKFHDMLIDLKAMKLDISDAFELKSRLLGNYKFSGVSATINDAGGYDFTVEKGLGSNELKIIAIDVDFPTSFAHEITHFRDVENSETRDAMIDHFSSKMDIDLLMDVTPQAQVGYYMNEREVLARLGEVGYMLYEYEYQDGETASNFLERVRGNHAVDKNADDKIGYSVSITKPPEVYAGDNNKVQEQIYFNLKTWTPTELSMVKDYVHGFFFKHDPKIESRLKAKIDAGELDYHSKMYDEKQKRKRVTRPISDSEKILKAFGRLDPKDLSLVYETGVKEGVFSDGEFLDLYSSNVTRVGKGGSLKVARKTDFDLIKEQLNAMSSLSDKIDPRNRPGDALIYQQLLNRFAVNSKIIKADSHPSALLNISLTDIIEKSKLLAAQTQWDVGTYEKSVMPRIGTSYYKLDKKIHQSIFTVQIEGIKEAVNDFSEKMANAQLNYSELSNTIPLARTLGINHLYLKSFGARGNHLPKRASDLQADLVKNQAYNLLYDAQESSPLIDYQDLLTNSLVDILLPIRRVMAEFATSELSIVKSMLNGGDNNVGWLKEHNIKDADVELFCSDFIDNFPTDISNVYSQYASSQEKLITIMEIVAKSSSNTGVKSPYEETVPVSLHSLNKNNIKDENKIVDTAKNLGVTPLVLLLRLTQSASNEPELIKKSLLNVFENEPEAVEKISRQLGLAVNRFDLFSDSEMRKVESENMQCHLPYNQSAKSLLLGKTLTSKRLAPTVLLQNTFTSELVNDYIKLSSNNTKTAVLRLNSTPRTPRTHCTLLGEGESEKSVIRARMDTLVKLLSLSVKSALEDKDVKLAESNPHYLIGKNDVDENESLVKSWLVQSRGIDKDFTDSILQSSSVFVMPNAVIDAESTTEKNAFIELSNAAKSVSLPFLMKNEYMGDIRKAVERSFEVVIKPEIEVVIEPEIEVVIEPEIEVVDNVITTIPDDTLMNEHIRPKTVSSLGENLDNYMILPDRKTNAIFIDEVKLKHKKKFKSDDLSSPQVRMF